MEMLNALHAASSGMHGALSFPVLPCNGPCLGCSIEDPLQVKAQSTKLEASAWMWASCIICTSEGAGTSHLYAVRLMSCSIVAWT
eukprot:1161508-Pelagomonas_calceolata.AAC.16